MIEAIFFDIDGTLLSFKTHKMTERLQKGLIEARKNGIKLFIATGRHVSEMEELEQYPYFDGYITLNGGYCFNENGVYYKEPIVKKDALKAIEIASENKHCIAFVSEDEMSVNFHNERLHQIITQANIPAAPIRDPKLLIDEDIYMLVLYSDPKEDDNILSQLPSLSAVRWHPSFVDVTPKHISKMLGVLKTCEIYGFHPENCMAFGDASNDIEMLSCVGHGIAMGNADEEVKQIAKEVTLSCEEDGIVHSLIQYGLIKNI